MWKYRCGTGRILTNEPDDVSSARHPFIGIITIPTSYIEMGMVIIGFRG
jgi:hypothetical protein